VYTFQTSKTVGENKEGWRVKRDTTHLGDGRSVYRYRMYDPVLRKWYPAISVGVNTVTMSDQGRDLWRNDRMCLPLHKRYRGLKHKSKPFKAGGLSSPDLVPDPSDASLMGGGGD